MNQDEEVNVEPCVKNLKRMYDLNHKEVYGLLIGLRGTIFNVFKKISKDIKLSKSLSDKIVKIVVNWSANILNYIIFII